MKQHEYISALQKHEITSSERELYKKTSEIGQTTKTNKQLLIGAYRKHKAGLELTAEESSVLFQERPELVTNDMSNVAANAAVSSSTYSKDKASSFPVSESHNSTEGVTTSDSPGTTANNGGCSMEIVNSGSDDDDDEEEEHISITSHVPANPPPSILFWWFEW